MITPAHAAVLARHPNAQIWKVEDDHAVGLVWFADAGQQWAQVFHDGDLVGPPCNVTAFLKAGQEDWDAMQFHNWGARD